jgi:hypothetical protein
MTINAYTSTTTLATTGTGVVVSTPGFQGKEVEIKVSGNRFHSDTTLRLSLGWGDGIRQNCDSLFADSTIRRSDKVTNKIVSLWDNVGGVATEILSASNPVFTATQLKLDVALANSNFQISVKITG